MRFQNKKKIYKLKIYQKLKIKLSIQKSLVKEFIVLIIIFFKLMKQNVSIEILMYI